MLLIQFCGFKATIKKPECLVTAAGCSASLYHRPLYKDKAGLGSDLHLVCSGKPCWWCKVDWEEVVSLLGEQKP